MKHPCIRWISLLLCTCLILTALPAGASPMDEQYRQRVFTRYDASFEESSYYENLLNSRAYLYEQWAANMEELPAAAEALTKPAELMLDKKLDAEAYTEYLLRLMAMVERGFTDTIASQASYTATLSGWDGVKGTTTIVGKLLPGGKTLSRISKALDGYGNAYDIYALVDEVVADEQQLALVSVSSALYQEKCMVLEAIIAHTDDKLLKEAAEALLSSYDAQFACLLGEYKQDALGIGVEVGSLVTGADVYNDILPGVAGIFADKLPKLAAKASAKVQARVATLTAATTKVAALIGPVYTGLVVGTGFSQLLFGDQMECYREMQAQEAISDALCKAFIETNNACAATQGDARYENTRAYVAIGEALIYSRLRGDYCNILSRYSYGDIKPLLEQVSAAGDGPVELDTFSLNLNAFLSGSVTDTQSQRVEELKQALEYYYWLEKNMSEYYWVLAGIFPENLPQVIVTMEREFQRMGRFYSAFYLPKVEVVGKPEVTQRINSNRGISTMLASEREKQATYASIPAEFNTYAYHTFTLREVDCVGDALCLSFSTHGFTNGAVYFDTEKHSFLFDLRTGIPLSLQSMLDRNNPNARESLIRIIADAIEEQEGWVWTTFEEVATALVDDTFYQDYTDLSGVPLLLGNQLVLQFNVGDIAPSAGGAPRITIPLSSLKGILDERFIPRELRYSGTCFFYLPALEQMPTGLKRIHGTESPEAVQAVGDVQRFRITESRYPEDWAEEAGEVYSAIVFYANYLTNEMVWVPENSGGSYLLEYNGKQEHHMAELAE